MRFWIGGYLHVTCISGVDVVIEAAIAVAALGPLRNEAILLQEHNGLSLQCSGADVKPQGPVWIRRGGRACHRWSFRPDAQAGRG